MARKHELLAALRQHEVFVLERGALEAYYPPEVTGADKPTKAQAFCKLCGKREAALGLCGDIPLPDGTTQNEFETIFSAVFESARG
jgi:putative ATP-dependent endonuclease of the OLD family